MQKIKTAADLKSAIEELEYKQAVEWDLLKEECLTISESLTPVNIIKNTFKEAISSANLKTNLFKAVIGFTTGLAAKKILIGRTHNPLKKFAGFLVEMFIANKVAKNTNSELIN